MLHIHPKQSLTSEEIQEIKNIFEDTYFKIDLEIREVDHIPRSKGGKFRYLIQNICEE
jgi:phenylacetate-coenzyme A ligase PaaK-like adenylate-forming protein